MGENSARNQFQDRKVFISEHQKGYGIDKHNRVIKLAENGRYVHGKRSENIENSAVTHVKRRTAEKLLNGRAHKTHYGQQSAEAVTENFSGTQTAAGNTQSRAERAADLKNQIQREIAVDKKNNKYVTQNITLAEKGDNSQKFQVKDVENANAKRYFSYKREKADYAYKKKIYHVEKKTSRLNNTGTTANHTLRELAAAGKEIVRPIKNGDAVGAAAIPAKIYLKKLLRKTKTGRLAVRTEEIGKEAAKAGENAADTSEAMQAEAEKVVKEIGRSAGRAVTDAVRDKHAKNKYLRKEKGIERAENKANKYIAKTYRKINEQELSVKDGTAPDKLISKINKSSENGTKQIAAAKDKVIAKHEKLEKKYQKAANKNELEKIKRSKKPLSQRIKSAVIGRIKKTRIWAFIMAGISAIAPFVLIFLLVVIVVVALFSWLNPFKYSLAGDDEKEEFSAENDEQIAEGYALMVQNYLDVAQARYYLTYGAYFDSYYDWIPAEEDPALNWGEYCNDYVMPKINTAVEEIRARYAPAIAAAQTSEEKSRLEAQMSEEISKTVTQMLEEGTEFFNDTVEALNDCFQKGEEIIYIPGESYTCRLEPKDGVDGIEDIWQYNANGSPKPCDGTNSFDLGAIEMQTDLTSEDIFAFIALSRTLTVLSDENGGETEETEEDTDEETADIFSAITPYEINQFFDETEFVQIEAHLKPGKCCGKCRRRLVGSWEEGWSWEYYCPGGHDILTGNISVKTKDELLQAVMEKYGAEDAGMSEDDCKDLIDDYTDFFDDSLGENHAPYNFGANDNSRAAEFYYYMLYHGGLLPNNMWTVDAPLESGESED